MQNWGLDRVSRDIMHAHCTPFIDHFVHAFHVFKNKLSVKSVVLLKSCTFLHHWVSCKGVADGLQDFNFHTKNCCLQSWNALPGK